MHSAEEHDRTPAWAPALAIAGTLALLVPLLGMLRALPADAQVSGGDIGTDGSLPPIPEGLVAVGAPYNDQSAVDAGRAYTYDRQGVVQSERGGSSRDDNYGQAIAVWKTPTGQVWTAVGAPRFDLGGVEVGRVTVYLGSTTLQLNPGSSGSRFGQAVRFVGDLNGDGQVDMAVGAPYDSTAGTGAGRVFVYFGPLHGGAADVVINGAHPGEHFGSAITGGEDLDGDGYDELVVGAPDLDYSVFGRIYPDVGRAFIYRGGANFSGIGGWALSSPSVNGPRFGASMTMAHDLNGDGYADLAVGAPDEGAGRVSIYLGGAPFNVTAAASLLGAAAGDRFGVSLASPDYNLDNYDDIAVGAEGNDANGAGAGAVFIYSGGAGPTFDTTADQVLMGPAGSSFGHAIAAFGAPAPRTTSPTGLVIGAFLHGPLNPGRAYIYWPMATLPRATLDGAASGDYFGISVAGY